MRTNCSVYLFVLPAFVLGLVALPLPTTANAQGTVLVVFHSDAPGQKPLRAFATKGADAGLVRIVECNLENLDRLSKRIPPALTERILDAANTMLADNTITDGTVMLQAYALVSSGRQIDAVPFGEGVLAGRNPQVEQVIKDVAAGIPPSPLRKAKVRSWAELFCNGLGWVAGLMLVYGMFFAQSGNQRFVCIGFGVLVIAVSAIFSPDAAADFAVTSLLIPLAVLFGFWLVVQWCRGVGWLFFGNRHC